MTFEEYRRHDATALAELVRTRAIKASEILELAIARAEAVNPKINAIIHPTYDLARKMSDSITPDLPFSGVPLLIKDLLMEVEGLPMHQGCRGFRGYVSKQDSYVVGKYRRAGMLFLGKTNLPEFGLTPFTEPELYGPTLNPWDTTRTTGGSSGGSAAAVAAGITPIATANDGGGSIRIPASCCGLFGLKSSRGRVSLGPMAGELWSGAVSEGCVSRSVRDSAALLDLIQGDGPGELHLTQRPARPYTEEVQTTPPRLRIGFATTHTLGQQTEPECIAAVHHTAKLLETLGHEVEEVPLPYRKEDLTKVFVMMVFGEAAGTVADLELHLGRKPRPSDVEQSTWALYLLGRAYSAMDFALAKRQWNEIARRAAAFHERYDLLLTPTLAMKPFVTGTLQPTKQERLLIRIISTFGLKGLLRANVDELAEKIFAFIPFTPIANMTGQPSMSVPLYWTEDGLPVGSMFTANLGREDLLFQLAGELEKAQPWFEKTPLI